MPESHPNNFLSGINAAFIAELYGRFLDDPAAVDPSWRRFFAEVGDDAAALKAERAGPEWAPRVRPNGAVAAARLPVGAEAIGEAAAASIRAMQLIRAYRV